jgi:hypothetical protein
MANEESEGLAWSCGALLASFHPWLPCRFVLDQ